MFVKPSNIEFDPRHKMKGKGGSAKRHLIRKTVIADARRSNLKADLGKLLHGVQGFLWILRTKYIIVS